MKAGEVVANGELVTVHIEIDGIGRRVGITREAIEDRLKLSGEQAALSIEQQCEFVRTHLPEVMSAVQRKIGVTSQTRGVVTLKGGEL